MITGLFAGLTWGIETVIMGIALAKAPFISTEQAVFLAPFVSTALHDSCSGIWILIYNAIRGQLKDVWNLLVKTKDGKFIVLASLIGGPIGMTGYMLCISHLGPSIGSIASAIYPAIGAALACIFLKEKMPWYRWIFLLCSLGGIAIISYSPGLQVDNYFLGIVGAMVYAFGMSIENVILAKCLKNPDVPYYGALNIRQLTSGITTGLVMVPLIGGWSFTSNIVLTNPENVILIIAIAALFGTVSYMLYAMALMKIGVAKSLALNGIYPVWAMVFSAIFLKETSSINFITIISALIVLAFGILAAIDFKKPEDSKSESQALNN